MEVKYVNHLTRNGIAYNLRLSPHIEVINYQNGEMTFVFSSDLYRRKFIEKREETKREVESIIFRRFGMRFECQEFSDVYLYKKIEKRGFLIYHNDKEATCLDDLNFNGQMRT